MYIEKRNPQRFSTAARLGASDVFPWLAIDLNGMGATCTLATTRGLVGPHARSCCPELSGDD
jgi:hypothetical protein